MKKNIIAGMQYTCLADVRFRVRSLAQEAREGKRKRIFKIRSDGVAHTANPNTREVVAGRSMSSRTAGAREKLLGLGK